MRVVPHPLMSVFLMTFWLLLNQSLSVGHILLGAVFAILGGWTLAVLQLPKARLQRPSAAIRLTFTVLVDIIRSNIAVGRIILGMGRQSRTPGFVKIPLDLRSPYGLAILACIITATPGTLWVDFDSAKRVLMIHVLDLIDESEWIQTIKGRYERLLLEIFP